MTLRGQCLDLPTRVARSPDRRRATGFVDWVDDYSTDASSGMTAHLDLSRLADIGAAGPSGQAGFIAEFRRHHMADSARLRSAATTSDFGQVQASAHSIEGACRVLGAGVLAHCSADVAAAAGRQDQDELRLVLLRFAQLETQLFGTLDALLAKTDEPPADLPATNNQPPLLCSGLRFFVVEDHEFQREMLVRLLRRLGAQEVRGFMDGASALAAARKPDATGVVLVIDLAMPGLNGIELAQKIGNEQLPVSVILNSALGEDMLSWPVQTAKAGGVIVLGAIQKPVTESKLAPLIARHRHLRSRRPA